MFWLSAKYCRLAQLQTFKTDRAKTSLIRLLSRFVAQPWPDTDSTIMALNIHATKAMKALTTAAITSVLVKQGLRNVWIRGSRVMHPEQSRVAGNAFTLRFIPGREDLTTHESLFSAKSTRVAIEHMPEGCVAVVDACGITDAGIFGDILCTRMVLRTVAGLVTDGAVRDWDGVKRTGLPVWCAGASALPSLAHLTFVDWQQPIACGGVAVCPNDVIVADQDGAVVIPEAMVDAVIHSSNEAEALEEWIHEEVRAGKELPGLYPPDSDTKARYERSRLGSGKRTFSVDDPSF
jgi:regulator of RNase E activity RraA